MHQIETKGLPVGPPIDDRTDAAASVIELTGIIKWFDASKGYGFIVPENGMSDILLHVTCLRRDGFECVREGARIVVEALRRTRGLQACRVLFMDKSTAAQPTPLPAPGSDVSAGMTTEFQRARVKWFHQWRGFGFLTRGEQTPDIFVHRQTLRRFGLAGLVAGQSVLVRSASGPKGMRAIELRPEPAVVGAAMH